MKRIAVSAGMVALGITAVQASSYGLNSMEASKAWSVEATLRGFYDDNINLSHSDQLKREGFGSEISPRVAINLPLEQTLLTAAYMYTYRYYEHGGGSDGNDSRCESTHQFDLSLLHNFSERYSIQVKDSFVYAEEPGLVDSSGSFPGLATAIRNYGSVKFSAEMTRLLSLVVGYRNSYYNYDDSFLSDRLDRDEHLANVDLRWLLGRNTVGVIGYEFGAIGYIENAVIDSSTPTTITSQDRNQYSHKLYIGFDRSWTPNLQTSLRVGGQYTDYYNDPLNSDGNVTPYTQGNLTYTYSANGSVTLGTSHTLNQTDAVSANSSDVTQNQESTAVFVDVNHRITPKLTGDLIGRYQHSVYYGGTLDGDSEDSSGLGLNFTYSFNQHLSAEAGYTYDCLSSSDIANRGYDRNRFYLGVTAAY